MNETCQNITSELICSEPVSRARSLETDGCVLFDNNGIVIEQEIRKDRDQYEESDDSKPIIAILFFFKRRQISLN